MFDRSGALPTARADPPTLLQLIFCQPPRIWFRVGLAFSAIVLR
jgi:hypothetical protein